MWPTTKSVTDFQFDADVRFVSQHQTFAQLDL